MDDLRFRKIFNLGITKDISGKKLSKLEKLQSLVAKCCKIRKIWPCEVGKFVYICIRCGNW